jgi:hypothetical protein
MVQSTAWRERERGTGADSGLAAKEDAGARRSGHNRRDVRKPFHRSHRSRQRMVTSVEVVMADRGSPSSAPGDALWGAMRIEATLILTNAITRADVITNVLLIVEIVRARDAPAS